MTNLPPDLINEILLLLPVKSLLRFRCICKSFYSIIDSPDFIYSHLRTSSAKRLHQKLICHGNYNNRTDIHALDTNSGSVEEIPLDFEFPYIRPLFVASCNGLLLLNPSDNVLSILNPSTRNYRELPALPVNFPLISYFGICRSGFGYDSTIDDYKVLQIICIKSCYQVWIFELRSSCWRRIQDFPYINYTDFRRAKVGNCFVDGYVYILCYENGNNESHIIVAFDLVKETFSIASDPISQNEGKHTISEACRGCLSITVEAMNVVDLYVQKNEGVEYRWTKLFSILEQFCPRTLGYSKQGENVLVSCFGNLYSYDLIERSFERIQTSLLKKICVMDLFDYSYILCVESLVSVGSS
ncbi:F-box protein CPR1-like [Euphorbia lathyris]|uniref:F-box protein CPR1-like n=1 Tax=Euphorbia lathyris TaxID=212925 RepID=UPI003313123F